MIEPRIEFALLSLLLVPIVEEPDFAKIRQVHNNPQHYQSQDVSDIEALFTVVPLT